MPRQVSPLKCLLPLISLSSSSIFFKHPVAQCCLKTAPGYLPEDIQIIELLPSKAADVLRSLAKEQGEDQENSLRGKYALAIVSSAVLDGTILVNLALELLEYYNASDLGDQTAKCQVGVLRENIEENIRNLKAKCDKAVKLERYVRGSSGQCESRLSLCLCGVMRHSHEVYDARFIETSRARELNLRLSDKLVCNDLASHVSKICKTAEIC